MATCLSNSRWVSRGLFDRAVEALGHEGITDVICLMGFYTSVSMTLAFYDVPAGATGMLSMRTRRDTRYRGSISLSWVFTSPRASLRGPLGPHRRWWVDTRDAFRPGAVQASRPVPARDRWFESIFLQRRVRRTFASRRCPRPMGADGAFTNRRATVGTALAGRGNQPFLCNAARAQANRAVDRRDGIHLGRWSAAWSLALGNDQRSNRISPDLLVVI